MWRGCADGGDRGVFDGWGGGELHVIKLPRRNALRGVFFCIYNRERFFDVIYIKRHKGQVGVLVLKVSENLARHLLVKDVKNA